MTNDNIGCVVFTIQNIYIHMYRLYMLMHAYECVLEFIHTTFIYTKSLYTIKMDVN